MAIKVACDGWMAGCPGMARHGLLAPNRGATLPAMPPGPLRIFRTDLAAIRAAARAAMPLEACGLLIGLAGDAVSRLEPATNVAAEPARRFEVDPRELLALHRKLRGTPESLIGHWHSHPNGVAVPSACDREMVSDPDMAWVIFAAPDGPMRAWRPVDGGFEEIPIEEVP
jgi:proteasome lid subunit RPN8/RPN11